MSSRFSIRRNSNLLTQASCEELLMLAIFSNAGMRPEIDRELDRRTHGAATEQTAPTMCQATRLQMAA